MKDLSRQLLRPLLVVATLSPAWALAQLQISIAENPSQLVNNVLLGGGIQVSNITFNGQVDPPNPQQGTGSFITIDSNLGLDAGIILSSGFAENIAQPAANLQSDQLVPNLSDPDLVAIAGVNINNAAVLEFDFIPTGDSLSFRYVFGSEEYPNFVCSYNDAFGFFLSGPGIVGPYTNSAVNIAVLPGTATPVTIANVNNGQGNNPNSPGCPAVNPEFYVNNTGGQTVVYNGMTVVLTAFAEVICGETYHIKLAIGDAIDQILDSGVFLEAGSFVSTGQVFPFLSEGVNVVDDTLIYAGCGPVELNFQRLGDTTNVDTIFLNVGGTAIPNVHYNPPFPPFLIYQPGDTVITLSFDVPPVEPGTFTIEIEIEQLILCAGVGVTNNFIFYIELPPPLVIDIAANDVNAICGEIVDLVPEVSGGSGYYSYEWSTGETTPSITVSPGVTTTYTFLVTDTCGVEPAMDSITVILPIYDPLVVVTSPDTLINCLDNGDIAVVSAEGGDGDYTYEWSLDGQILGTDPILNVPYGPSQYYYVTVSEGCGTSVTDSVLVGTVPLDEIVITTSPDQTAICPGYMVTLAVEDVTGGNGVYTYTWTDQQGTFISGNTSIDVEVPSDHTYTITVEDQCGYEAQVEVQALLPNLTPLVLALTPNQVICAGESIDLWANVTGGSGYYFIEWHDMEHTDPTMEVAPLDMTTYTVSIYDECGSQVTRSVIIDVEHFHVEIVVNQPGLDQIYLLAASDPPADIFLWDLGDGTRKRGKEVVHRYLNYEEHWVFLEATSPNGCLAMDSVLIRPPGQLWFPNAFTPDGDGVNDMWGPKGVYIENFEMTIFDRWGQEVFRTTDMDQLWDGTAQGSNVPVTGVYVYKYKASGHLFPATEGYGHVTVLPGSAE
jgi:gliding motility-associated-like protein